MYNWKLPMNEHAIELCKIKIDNSIVRSFNAVSEIVNIIKLKKKKITTQL